jgi:SAM-dependent methyltransferase
VRGWFGGLRERRDYWGRFYTTSGHRVPSEPSTFAQWVAEQEQPGRLLDLGCGNGRDSRFFAERGFEVVGLDVAPRHARRALQDLPQETRPQVRRVNLDSLQETLFAGARLAHERGPRTVYARFVLNALGEYGRENAWTLISMALAEGGRGYLEFRTPRDSGLPKHFGKHFRRFLAPRRVEAEAERHGLRVLHREVRRGWSPLGEENPYLCRVILERKS